MSGAKLTVLQLACEATWFAADLRDDQAGQCFVELASEREPPNEEYGPTLLGGEGEDALDEGRGGHGARINTLARAAARPVGISGERRAAMA